jgi:Ca-activated chloride channel homolog
VDLPRRQMLASVIVRSTIVTLLVMSLSGLILMTGTRETFVVFAVDESLSVGSTFRLEADDFVEAATEGRPNDQWAVLPFAAQPG